MPEPSQGLAIRIRAVDYALRLLTANGELWRDGDLWSTVRDFATYLATGETPDDAQPEPEPEPPGPPVILGNLAMGVLRRFNAQGDIARAAQAWYDKIPDGSNVGAWAGDEDVALINAVRVSRGLPEFRTDGDEPWTK